MLNQADTDRDEAKITIDEIADFFRKLARTSAKDLRIWGHQQGRDNKKACVNGINHNSLPHR